MIAPAPRRRSSAPTTIRSPALYHAPAADHVAAFDHAVRLIHGVCCLAGSPTLINDNRRSGGKRLRAVIQDHDTGALFDCLVNDLSYQGIADAVAAKYIAQHGQVTWAELQHKLARRPSCPKLRSYWAFSGCRYDKGSRTCAEPEHNLQCPLPRHDLRNGHLNQAAYSLFMFIRDIANGDLVAWIDDQLAAVDDGSAGDRDGAMQEALLGPLREVYGVSDKVLAMALSIILFAAPDNRPRWRAVGVSLIAIDTLVHNFLHRTGILARFDAQHSYGSGCYRPGGCADIIRNVAQAIDAREFNRKFPQTFPRFVQHAIWRYCAASGLNICTATG